MEVGLIKCRVYVVYYYCNCHNNKRWRMQTNAITRSGAGAAAVPHPRAPLPRLGQWVCWALAAVFVMRHPFHPAVLGTSSFLHLAMSLSLARSIGTGGFLALSSISGVWR